MAGISMQTAREHLELWLEAEAAVATSQSYQIGGRMLTRANLREIRNEIVFWQNQVARLENMEGRRGRNRVTRVVPRDL